MLSFQASQQNKLGDDIPLGASRIKYFLNRIAEKYTLQKKSNTSCDTSNSPAIMVNEVMETVSMPDDKQVDTAQSAKQLIKKIYWASLGSTLTWGLLTRDDYSKIFMLSLMKLPLKELVQNTPLQFKNAQQLCHFTTKAEITEAECMYSNISQ